MKGTKISSGMLTLPRRNLTNSLLKGWPVEAARDTWYMDVALACNISLDEVDSSK